MNDRTPLMVARLLGTQPEQNGRGPLGSSGQRTQEGETRPTVRIVRCARTLLDSTNLHGAQKWIEDRLVEAGIITDDGPQDIILEVAQIKVGTAAEVGTSITVSWPGDVIL